MSDVEGKRADFSALLVYDVSRWGRFQDVDESAYYEYVLKRAGIACTIALSSSRTTEACHPALKALKRSMAAEYSRELPVKVFSGSAASSNWGSAKVIWSAAPVD